jgi:hypothetical protein
MRSDCDPQRTDSPQDQFHPVTRNFRVDPTGRTERGDLSRDGLRIRFDDLLSTVRDDRSRDALFRTPPQLRPYLGVADQRFPASTDK